MNALELVAHKISRIHGLDIKFIAGRCVEFDHKKATVVTKVDRLLKAHDFFPGRKGRKLVLTSHLKFGGGKVSAIDTKVTPFIAFLKRKVN